ncbi:hypothetical protein [Clostridium perfringens]|uniref:hypothetical protein n=2 Tax=Clostridium TaxID=1485 RepID=UPI001C85A965|nr:hypothetical protein [Clostridium perfringens]MDJ8959760.1 hypothetical protein [Clostridium perfringens]MDU4427627.1 hypothetical protein [Clostridium sp.]MDU7458764.1 hypothetical protein [Clostridium perfringens]
MSMGAMRCNRKGCNGLVVYEDADYDYREAVLNGDYIVDNDLVCDTCGRKFKAVVTHTFIYDDEELGEVEELEHACITEWLRKRNKH